MQANPKLSTTPPLPGVVAVPALNDALQTIATDFSGDTDPAALAWPFSKWADTSTGLLKRRNAAGTEWVVEGSLFRRALNIIPSDQIPTSDIGLISTPSQGLMEWDGSRYVAKWADHGQCEFVYVSPVECRLMPRDGDGLIINGRQYRIDPAGVPLSIADVAGAPGSTNYVYAKDNGAGGFSLESSTTGHSRHTDGVRIKTGDPTRTLVGVAYKNASSEFQFDDVMPGVASWFNGYSNTGRGNAYLAGTASTTPVQVAPSVHTWTWDGEEVAYGTAGVASVDTAGSEPRVGLYLDGVAVSSVYGNVLFANGSIPAGMSAVTEGLTEGFHHVDMRLAVGGGGTAYLTSSYFVRALR